MGEPMEMNDLLALAEKAREEIDVPWDDVRQARVHRRALEAFREEEAAGDTELVREDEPEVPEEVVPTVPLRGWPRWIWAAAAAMLLVGFGWASFRASRSAPAVASIVGFSDGSRSMLYGEAEVQVLKDENATVRVRQHQGRVRYEIEPRPSRTFSVLVQGVKVTVLGTVFDVYVHDGRVEVKVTRGRVRVERGEQVVILTAGDRVEMAAGIEGEEPAAEADVPPTPVASASTPPPRAPALPAVEAPKAPEQGAGGGAPDAATLLARADAARASGSLDEAARLLRRLVATHPRDPRVTLALFSLGRVERRRGHHQAAAQAFEQCGAGLRGDAMAEAAASWIAAGQPSKARAAAQRYVTTYPEGVHAAQMRALADGN